MITMMKTMGMIYLGMIITVSIKILMTSSTTMMTMIYSGMLVRNF